MIQTTIGRLSLGHLYKVVKIPYKPVATLIQVTGFKFSDLHVLVPEVFACSTVCIGGPSLQNFINEISKKFTRIFNFEINF